MIKMVRLIIDEMDAGILAGLKWKTSAEKADIQTISEVKQVTFSRKNFRSRLFNLIKLKTCI